jgi:hypothetical protein
MQKRSSFSIDSPYLVIAIERTLPKQSIRSVYSISNTPPQPPAGFEPAGGFPLAGAIPALVRLDRCAYSKIGRA